MKTKIIFSFLIILSLFFLSINSVWAECRSGCTPDNCASGHCNTCSFCSGKSLGQIGGEEEGFGPWGNLGKFLNVSEAAGAFTNVISRTIGVMTIIAGIWFLFQFIIGAYGYLSASGEPKKMSDATAKITSSLIGLVVIVAAYAIISLLGSLLGFDILNPQKLIEILGPK